ncbi:MAG: hypothetical protein ACRERD_22125, partial [Candidatus Binatia bacterium]
LYVLSKSDGMIRQLAAVMTLPPEEPSPALEVRITTSADDAEEKASGKVLLTNGTLKLESSQTVGLRFTSVSIPRGATIQRVWVQFTAGKRESKATVLTIKGQAVDHASPFTTMIKNLSSRAKTTAAVSWSPEPWTVVGEAGLKQRTPDLAGIIQEVVSRPGWSNGNALALIITGTGLRTARSFNGDANGAPFLYVEYASAP